MRALLVIGESIYLAGGTKIVGILFASQDRGFPSGFFDCGTRVGLAVSAPVIATLIVYYGSHRMFAVVGFSALLWLVPWLLVAPRNLQGARHGAASASSSVVRARRVPVHLNRKLFGICLGFFCLDYYWYLLVTWLPDYLVTVRHLTVLRAGFYAALPFLVCAICEPIGGWVTDWLIRCGQNETRTRKTLLTVAFLSGLMLIPVVRGETTTSVLAAGLLAYWFIVGELKPETE
jgi:MFS transporter, ACS family, D-galactonate transporter